MKRKPTTPAQRLRELQACEDSIVWIRRGKYRTLGAAWKACPRGDWMLWLAGKAEIDSRVLMRAADAYAYAYAYDGDAYSRVLAKCADIVRRMIPWPVVSRALRGAK